MRQIDVWAYLFTVWWPLYAAYDGEVKDMTCVQVATSKCVEQHGELLTYVVFFLMGELSDFDSNEGLCFGLYVCA